MDIVLDKEQVDQSVTEHQATKAELLQRYAAIRRAQHELVVTGNADLLPASVLEWGQLSCELRHRLHVPDCELMEALAKS